MNFFAQIHHASWHVLTIIAYLGAFFTTTLTPSTRIISRIMFVIALVLHGVLLWLAIYRSDQTAMTMSFALALSLTGWLGCLVYGFSAWQYQANTLLRWSLIAAMAASSLPLLFSKTFILSHTTNGYWQLHWTLAFFTLAFVFVVILHSMAMQVISYRLHAHQIDVRNNTFPPLLVLESILFRSVWALFLALSVTLLTGAYFSEQLVGDLWQFNHKTLFGLLAWLALALLLFGRNYYSWRGKIAIRMSLLGAFCVLVGYVGSRFVFEIILQRSV